jgi:hypothetical protein
MTLRMRTASTDKVDDADAATAEVLAQLDLKSLLKNSVGLVACHSEFTQTGVLKALCDRLPFDTVGCTTLASVTRGAYGYELLSVSVLTSDDIGFSAAVSGDIFADDIERPIEDMYRRAALALHGAPALALAYAPLVPGVGGSRIYNSLAGLCGRTPLFGTFSCENTMRFVKNRVIWNGEAFRDSLALVLMSGDVKPRFLVNGIPEKSVQKRNAVVTESDGCVIKKINDMTAVDYLTAKRLVDYSDFEAHGVVGPFLADYGDGTGPVTNALLSFTPQGYARCGCDMPVGVTISIGSLDYDGVIETARLGVEKLLAIGGKSALLMYSGISRNLLLGTNPDDVMKMLQDMLSRDVPYQFCYSGGEICPLENGAGEYVNHFHNFTFVACAF